MIGKPLQSLEEVGAVELMMTLRIAKMLTRNGLTGRANRMWTGGPNNCRKIDIILERFLVDWV